MPSHRSSFARELEKKSQLETKKCAIFSFFPAARPSCPRTVRVVVLVVVGEQFDSSLSTVRYFGFINAVRGGILNTTQPISFCLTLVL